MLELKLQREADQKRISELEKKLADESEKNLSALTSIVDTMANTRLDDQRCQLGVVTRKHNKKQEKKNSDLLNIFQHPHAQVKLLTCNLLYLLFILPNVSYEYFSWNV